VSVLMGMLVLYVVLLTVGTLTSKVMDQVSKLRPSEVGRKQRTESPPR